MSYNAKNMKITQHKDDDEDSASTPKPPQEVWIASTSDYFGDPPGAVDSYRDPPGLANASGQEDLELSAGTKVTTTFGMSASSSVTESITSNRFFLHQTAPPKEHQGFEVNVEGTHVFVAPAANAALSSNVSCLEDDDNDMIISPQAVVAEEEQPKRTEQRCSSIIARSAQKSQSSHHCRRWIMKFKGRILLLCFLVAAAIVGGVFVQQNHSATVPPPENTSILLQQQDDLTLVQMITQTLNTRHKLYAIQDNYTFFAPTDKAFDTFDDPKFLIKLLLPEWEGHLLQILNLHTVPGLVSLAELDNGSHFETMAGLEQIVATTTSTSVSLSSGPNPFGFNESWWKDHLRIEQPILPQDGFVGSNVVEGDLFAHDSVVHKVDQVFMPAILTRNLYQVAEIFDDGRGLIPLLIKAGLEDEMRFDTLTIFLPPAVPLAEFFKERSEFINDREYLRALLMNFAVPGVWYEWQLTNGLQLTTLMNETFMIENGPDFDYPRMNNAKVFSACLANNGLLYFIDTVLAPTI